MVAPSRVLRSSGSTFSGWSLALIATLAFAPASSAVTPNSPEVQKLVRSGLNYLDTRGNDYRLGGKCLIGLALIKNGADVSHPRVVEAVKMCQAAVGKELQQTTVIYNLSLAVIFLCELDPILYRTEIESIFSSILASQKEHGGWGYPRLEVGDTSVTQYAVLCLWEAKRAGFDVPLGPIERVTNWLLRTQDPNGGWGYRGRDNGTFVLQVQDLTTRPRTASSLGSLTICATMLGMIDLKARTRREDVPAALSLPQSDQEPKDTGPRPILTTRVSRARVNAAIADGDRWIQMNYQIDQETDDYIYYYLYALERYMSFRELAGEGFSASSPWYDEGYLLLNTTKTDKGSWSGRIGPAVDTAFAVLFLTRSTRKSLGIVHSYGDGSLIGGRGLPRNIVDTELHRGSVVSKGDSERRVDLIKVLSDPYHPDYELLINNPRLADLGKEQPPSADDVERLRRLIHDGQPEQRIVAVRVLARTRDFDNVPTLLYAMTDPDWRVVREASDGLRFTSRTFEGFELPRTRDDQARATVLAKWRLWYLKVRPGETLETVNPRKSRHE